MSDSERVAARLTPCVWIVDAGGGQRLAGGVAENAFRHQRRLAVAPLLIDLCADRMNCRAAGFGARGEFDQMARNPHIAFMRKRLRARGELLRSAGEHRDLGGQRCIGGGLQIRRVAVIPTAVHAPQIAHDEFRFVVQRSQIRLFEHLRRHLHAVDDLVQRRAGIHHGECFADQLFERFGHFEQHALDALRTADRQSVRRQKQFSAGAGHLAHRRGPLDRIALHLLRIAGVREIPDEKVTGADRLVLRYPRPRVVVGLALGVAEVEFESTDAQREAVAVGDVGFRAVAGQKAAGIAAECLTAPREAAKLARIDREVVAVGQIVAIEPARHVFVAGDGWPRRAAVRRIGQEGAASADMIDVAVRVDQCIEARLGPAANCIDDARAALRAAGIEHHEPVVGIEQYRMRKRLDHRDARRDLGEFVVDAIDRASGASSPSSRMRLDMSNRSAMARL